MAELGSNSIHDYWWQSWDLILYMIILMLELGSIHDHCRKGSRDLCALLLVEEVVFDHW